MAGTLAAGPERDGGWSSETKDRGLIYAPGCVAFELASDGRPSAGIRRARSHSGISPIPSSSYRR